MPDSNAKTWRSRLFLEAGPAIEDGLRRVSGLLEELESFLRTVPGLSADDIADLRLVCDEIAANAVRHAAPAGAVCLDIEVEAGESVRLRMADDGAEFNPFTYVLPYLGPDLERRKIGGLGLHLIRQLFPSASYRRCDGLNIIEVKFRAGKGRKRIRRVSRSSR